jgi:uncharacterized protein involved in exopolysaccharide biosynthesis
MEENTIKDNTPEEKEIDLLALGKKLWDRKKFILKVMGIGAVIGLVVAFSIPKEYTTTVILIPDSQSSGSGTMGSLAILAGINLNNTNDNAIASPNLYPTILETSPFMKGLFNIPIKEGEINMTLHAYMKEHIKRPWWGYITKCPSFLKKTVSPQKSVNDSAKISQSYIPEEDIAIIEELTNRLTVNYGKKAGVITIEVTMQSPEVAALIADTLTLHLQSYIIEYRTQKAREDLLFAEKLHQEAKENYNKAQTDLASFIDGNMNVVSAKYRTTQERLQNEASLAYSVYNQTAQQFQMAKVKVQNTTPVFTIIQPAIEPLHASKPQKKIIVIEFLFLSFIGVSIWILKKDIKVMLFDKE